MANKPVLQGGVQNYLGKQKQVTAPVKWKSSPDHPETELAYITKAEKDLLVKKDLHGSLKGGVNRGPSGIMSLNGFGSFDSDDKNIDTGMSGAATSAAERGGGSGADRKELESYISRDNKTQLPPGVTRQLPQDIKDYRNAFIAAGGGQRVNPGFFDSRFTVSPQEIRNARDYVRNRSQFKSSRLNPGLAGFFTGGGILGNIVRGLGQRFGLGKTYDQPTYDMRGIVGSVNPNNLDIYNEFVDEEEDSTKRFTDTGITYLKNNPELQALYERDRNLSLLNTSVPSPAQTGLTSLNLNADIPFAGTVLQDEFPSNRKPSFIEALDPPYYDEFFNIQGS